MRIGIQTWGTHGDIIPFIALAEGLQSAGHQVSLVITSIYTMNYEKHGSSDIKITQIASPVISTEEEYSTIDNILLNERNPLKQAKLTLPKILSTTKRKSLLVLLNAANLQGGDFYLGLHYELKQR